MKIFQLHIILMVIGCVLSAKCLHAQELQSEPAKLYDHKIEADAYQALSEELDWSDTKKVLRLKEFEREEKEVEEDNENKRIGIGGPIFQIIGYAAVIIVIGFILYLILGHIKLDPRLEKDEFEVVTVDDIEDIELIDAEQGLKDALSAGDYRLALGMHYVLILQRLAAEEAINWEPSKTNRDYIREMRKDPRGRQFAAVSRAYDLSLYGDREFGEEQYQALLPDLQLLASPLQVTVDE